MSCYTGLEEFLPHFCINFLLLTQRRGRGDCVYLDLDLAVNFHWPTNQSRQDWNTVPPVAVKWEQGFFVNEISSLFRFTECWIALSIRDIIVIIQLCDSEQSEQEKGRDKNNDTSQDVKPQGSKSIYSAPLSQIGSSTNLQNGERLSKSVLYNKFWMWKEQTLNIVQWRKRVHQLPMVPTCWEVRLLRSLRRKIWSWSRRSLGPGTPAATWWSPRSPSWQRSPGPPPPVTTTRRAAVLKSRKECQILSKLQDLIRTFGHNKDVLCTL